MSKPKRKAKDSIEVRLADHAERSRMAMQKASSVRAIATPVAAQPPSTKSRKDRKGVVIYLTPEAKEQLARLAHDQRKSVQTIGLEAINLLFESNRLKPIA